MSMYMLCHRLLEAVDLSTHSGVPGYLPPYSLLAFEAHFILNTSRDLGTWINMRATLRSGNFQSRKNGAGEVLNTRVDNLAVKQFWFERNLGFQVGLEIGPVSSPDIRSIRLVLVG